MASVSHQGWIDGDVAALGDGFRPAPAGLAELAARRLVAPDQDIEPLVPDATYTWKLVLELPVWVILYMLSSEGRRLATARLAGGSAAAPTSYTINAPDAKPYSYLVIEATSGAFIRGFTAKAGDVETIGASALRPANNPGLPTYPGELPSPARSGSPLPADSPPVLIGAGVLTDDDGNDLAILARTQHWQKSGDSYSLPGCASLGVTLTKSTGVTRSSSEMKVVATAVGLSMSAGWGPISASMSASMSQSSSTSQDVSISDTTEATVIRELRNLYTTPMVVYLWQLVDRVLILDKKGYKLTAMVETLSEPVIPMSYDSAGQKFPPPGAVLCPIPKASDGREDER